jgi:hypothetical protein
MTTFRANQFILGFVFIGQIFFFTTASVFAEEGERVGNTWTDEEGNNYEGDPSSGSSSSYGWQYTYGYVNGTDTGSGYTGPTWAERQEAAQVRAEAQRMAQATQINDEGVKYSNQGNFQKALEQYEKAAAINPTDPVIQNNILSVKGTIFNEEGIQYYTAGNYQAAAESYRKALELKPDSEVIRQNLADAEQQFASQQEWQRKEDIKKAEMTAAGTKIQGMLTNLSQDLKKPAAQPSALSFKPAEAPSMGYEGDHKIARREELAFKNMQPKKTYLEERPDLPQGGSTTVRGQLNSVEFHSKNAGGSAEGVMAGMGIGFDTAGVKGEGLPESDAIDVPAVGEGVPLVEVLPPPVPAEKSTPAIAQYETERGELFTKRQEIETKVAEMEKAGKPDPVAIVKLKEEATQIKNKENFLSFQITEELAKAPETKTETPPAPKSKEGNEVKG